MDRAAVLDQMIQALQLELEKIRQQQRTSRRELTGGKKIASSGDRYLYRFFVPEGPHFRDDTPVELIVGERKLNGEVVSFQDGELVIALAQDLGDTIDHAMLVIDESFLLERLISRLQEIRSGCSWFNYAAADRTLKLAPFKVGAAEPDPRVISDGKGNDEQLRAVRLSLGSDLVFIWGPPGTGKTETLARITEAHYRAGRSILLVSNTNIAVDTALEKVAERLCREPEFKNGLVIRYGSVVKKELREQFGREVILDEVVERRARHLREERQQILNELQCLEERYPSLQQALADLRELEQTLAELVQVQQVLEETRRRLASAEKQMEAICAQATRLKAEAERKRSNASLVRKLLFWQQARLERQAREAEQKCHEARETVRRLHEEVESLRNKATTLGQKVETLQNQTRNHPPPQQIKDELEKNQRRIQELSNRIDEIDKHLERLRTEILTRCRVLATTVYKAYLASEISSLRKFETVVIDEASMLMPPLVYHSAGLAQQALVIAGDFRQLPPIVQCNDQLAHQWLKRDVFEVCDIPGQVQKHSPVAHLVILKTQYRMREPICQLVASLFYPEINLLTAPEANRLESHFPWGNEGLFYLDTKSCQPRASFHGRNGSRYNLVHAILCAHLVLHLHQEGLRIGSGNPADAIGVVTPYRAQARLLQCLLRDCLGPEWAGAASTVHRFQGNQKAAIIIDLPESPPKDHLGRFLKAVHVSEEGARLLNVALSRARQYVILVGNLAYLKRKAPRDGYLQRVLEGFLGSGQPLDVGRLLEEMAGTGWGPLSRPVAAFEADTFVSVLRQDLESASRTLTVAWPSITGQEIEWWDEVLQSIAHRGIRVQVIIGHSSDEDGKVRHVIRDLQRNGIVIEDRDVSEPLVLLDDRIAWYGSLRLRPLAAPTGWTFRVQSPEFCSTTRSYLGLLTQSEPSGHD